MNFRRRFPKYSAKHVACGFVHLVKAFLSAWFLASWFASTGVPDAAEDNSILITRVASFAAEPAGPDASAKSQSGRLPLKNCVQ
jgi:hypothetical protein